MGGHLAIHHEQLDIFPNQSIAYGMWSKQEPMMGSWSKQEPMVMGSCSLGPKLNFSHIKIKQTYGPNNNDRSICYFKRISVLFHTSRFRPVSFPSKVHPLVSPSTFGNSFHPTISAPFNSAFRMPPNYVLLAFFKQVLASLHVALN